jgi:hypothetical protein
MSQTQNSIDYMPNLSLCIDAALGDPITAKLHLPKKNFRGLY